MSRRRFPLRPLVLVGVLATWIVWAFQSPWVVSAPWDSPRLERPTAIGLTSEGDLRLVDRDGHRVVVLSSPTDLKEGTADQALGMVEADPTVARAVAAEVGGTDLQLTLTVQGPGFNQAWLDPWLGVVVWAPHGQGPRLVEAWIASPLDRGASALWYLGALVMLAVGGRWVAVLVGRWLRSPGLVGPKLAWLALPWALVGGAVCWVGLVDGAREAERPARWTEMGLVARQVLDAHGLNDLVDDDYEVRLFRWTQEGPIPRPRGGSPSGLRAAVATGLPQFREIDGPTGHLTSVSLASRGASPLVVEVLWDRADHRTAGSFQTLGLSLLGVVLGYGVVYGGLLWLVCWIRGPQRRGSGRWIDAVGPDALAPLGGLPPVRRWATVVTWSGDCPGWETHLRLAGAWEVWSLGPQRSVVLWGSRSLHSRLLRDYRGEDLPPYRATRRRLIFGAVDRSGQVEALVAGIGSVANRRTTP